MVTRLTPSDRDLVSLAQVVSQERPDLPEAGLPFSLLTEVVDQIPCDYLMFRGYDSVSQEYWFDQAIDPGTADLGVPDEDGEEIGRAFWKNYWDCGPCSYPDRTGDFRQIVTVADFYSVRQWHSTAMYCDVLRPQGIEHQVGLCLPEPPRPEAGAGRTIRLYLLRGPGLDFTERDRALLTLLRPHLHQAFLDAERRRSPIPDLTPRQWELLHLIRAGHTNSQIARELRLSEGTVRTHLENIYGRLDVSNRTAALMRAFPERVA